MNIYTKFVALAGLLAMVGWARGQVPTLHVSTRLVLLDTQVVDAKGQPVLGLTAKDFAVYEDGAPQTVISFETPDKHGLPGMTGGVATGIDTVFDPAKPTAFGPSPVTVFVLDEVNTHFADSAYAVHSIEQYLKKQGAALSQPATLLVVKDSRFEQLAPFTLDRDRLLAALKKHVPEQAWALEQSMSVGAGVGDRLDRSLAALEQVAQYTARVPGHKSLVWVGAGFPSVDPQALTEGTDAVLHNMLQHVTDVMLANRITLYAVDPTTTAASTTEITDPVQLAFASATSGGGRIIDPFEKTVDFDRLGPVTGGKVIRGSNDVDGLIGQSIAAGANYYTLGYRPSNLSDLPGKFRKIRIVCLRAGLVATTHDGYYTSSPKATLAADTIGYDLNNAATASVPFNAVAFTADREGDGFTVHANAADLTWVGTADGRQTASVQVLAVVLSPKRKILGHTLLSETATAEAGVDTRATGQRVRFTATMPEGSVGVVRLVVRDQASGRMGSLDLGK